MSRKNGEAEQPFAQPFDGRSFVIGMAGGTCSGKTTMTEMLVDMLGPQNLTVIKQDAYYIDRTHQPMEDRRRANYDHPDAFDFHLTRQQLTALLDGRSIDVPTYDYPNHNRAAETIRVSPTPVIVFEGILALYDEALRDLFDLKVFVDTEADVRLIRRLRRDVIERGRTPESIMNQYMATVRPSHVQFIEPSKRYADIIVNEGYNDASFEILVARIRDLLP